MPCFCGGGSQCFCRLTYIIYKWKCMKCFQCYIGKTIRELGIRVAEHLRAIKNGKGSALARHQCNHHYEVRVLARSENNSLALGIMEGKMMSKYKPKINIKNEKRARENAEKMGKLLRNKDSCKPDDRPQRDDDNNDYEDQCEYWIESSDWFSNEVESECESGDMSEAEASEELKGNKKVTFNANNYAFLAAIEANKHNKPFITMAPNSDEEKQMAFTNVNRVLLV